MASRVEADPNVVLGLKLGEGRTTVNRDGHRLIKVVHPNLQMHHHVLITRPSRPSRPDEIHFPLEGQPYTIRYPNDATTSGSETTSPSQ